MTTDAAEDKEKCVDRTPQSLIANRPEFSVQSFGSAKEEGDGWIVSFLDMMILVLTFFVAFIATQMPDPSVLMGQSESPTANRVESKSEERPGSAIPELSDDRAPALPAGVNQAVGSGKVSIGHSSDGVTMTIDDRFVFASGSADISPEGIRTIEKLVPLVNDLPGKIEVFGHTDNIPISTDRFDTNWELSSARAVNIVRLLIMQGVDEDRLRAVGVAHTQPIATNATEVGRSKNRRVEIQIRKQ